MCRYSTRRGNPQVNRFVIDHFSKVVTDFGVDIFRQDGANVWPEDTDPKRAGMSQIQYIQGFYAFWDGLLQRHPHLLIDNCAEGARKIDLETIRRSVVLWRSDCQAPMNFDPVVNQGFNYGLLQWIPLACRVDIHNARDNVQSNRPRRLTIRTRNSPHDQELGNRSGLSRREALAPSQDDDFIPVFDSADTRLPAARRREAEFYFER
jgi:alpha-galactosidase